MTFQELIKSCLQYNQVPSYFDNDLHSRYFFYINKIYKTNIYKQTYNCLIRHVMIYNESNGLFILHNKPYRKLFHINKEIQLGNDGIIHVENTVFPIGGEFFRELLLTMLFDKSTLIAYMADKNFLRYFFPIKYKDKNSILIIANENCQIVECNYDFIEKLQRGFSVDFNTIISHSVFLKSLDKKDDLYDILLINYIEHNESQHDDKHKIVLVRYSKKKQQVLFTQEFSDECIDINKNISNNEYSN